MACSIVLGSYARAVQVDTQESKGVARAIGQQRAVASPHACTEVRRESVIGSWGKAMRGAVRNKERWGKGAVRLPKILVLTHGVPRRIRMRRDIEFRDHANAAGLCVCDEICNHCRGVHVLGVEGAVRGQLRE